jgi:hypothetical protein
MENTKEIRTGGKEPPRSGTQDLASRFDAAYLDYSRVVQGVLLEVGRAVEDVRRNLAVGVHAAAAEPNAAPRITELHKDAESTLAGVNDSLGVRKRLDEAYAVYLEAIKAAWASVDPKALPPTALVNIVNSLAAGLQCALATQAS